MRMRIALAGGLLLAASVWSAAQSRVRIVVLNLVEHGVEVQLPAGSWTAAARNAPVVEGESIRTQSGGVAEVQLECGSALRLTPGSELAFPRLVLSAQGIPATTVALNAGEAFFSMQKGDSPDFRIQLPGAILSLPHGAARLRLNVSANAPASFEVLHGRVQLKTTTQSAIIKSSRRVILSPGGGFQTLPLAPADAWQNWSHRRDQRFEREAFFRHNPPPPLVVLPPASTTPTSVPPVVAVQPGLAAINAIAAKPPSQSPIPYCAHP